MTFRFHLRPHGRFDAAELRRVGAATEQPLLATPASLDAPLPALPFSLEGSAVVASALGLPTMVGPSSSGCTTRRLRPRARDCSEAAGVARVDARHGGAPGQPITRPDSPAGVRDRRGTRGTWGDPTGGQSGHA